jgi:tRNA pseudouridine55 synthase
MSKPCGYLLVDKPVGPSSHGAVQSVRRQLGFVGKRGTKAGHAGTLDPFASGLLIVLIGRATRLMPNVVGHDKRYLVDIRFGASSDTDDATGTLTGSQAPAPEQAAVADALAMLAAQTEQVPPAVSAIHIDGVRAYRRVRRGETIDVPPRPVRFDSIELVAWHDAEEGWLGPRVVLDVRCGTGTYMRALARDLGDAVGCPAHCEALRRTEVGEWTIDQAAPLDGLRLELVRDSLDILDDTPRLVLDAAQVLDIAAGRRLPLPTELASAPQIALVGPDGSLVALARPTSDGTLLQPNTVLVDPPPPTVQGSPS